MKNKNQNQILIDTIRRLQVHKYEMLRKEEVLKTKLVCRALKSENDINEGKVFSRTEIDQRIKNAHK